MDGSHGNCGLNIYGSRYRLSEVYGSFGNGLNRYGSFECYFICTVLRAYKRAIIKVFEISFVVRQLFYAIHVLLLMLR